MPSKPELHVRHALRKRNGKIRFRKFNASGAEHFAIRLYVEGDVDALESVTYELHPTFPNRVRHVRDPQGGFKLDIWTWGEFDVDVTFHRQDGESESTVYPLEYGSELPSDPGAYVDETDPSVRGRG